MSRSTIYGYHYGRPVTLKALAPAKPSSKRRPSRLAALAAILAYGAPNPRLVCPHCGARGFVCAKSVSLKAGISGGKMVAALLTGGLSMLATGLSRRQSMTKATCRACNSTWHF